MSWAMRRRQEKFVREAREAVATACGVKVDAVCVIWSGRALGRRRAYMGVSERAGLRFEATACFMSDNITVDAYKRLEGYNDGCDVL